MSVIFLLIITSLIVAVGFLLAFLWAVKSGQFEDKFTPSIRVILDEKTTSVEKMKENKSEEK